MPKGQELDDDMVLKDADGLDNGADVSALVRNLNDEDDVWSDYRTYYNDNDRTSGSNPCLDLKSAASIGPERISLATAGVRNVYPLGGQLRSHHPRMPPDLPHLTWPCPPSCTPKSPPHRPRNPAWSCCRSRSLPKAALISNDDGGNWWVHRTYAQR